MMTARQTALAIAVAFPCGLALADEGALTPQQRAAVQALVEAKLEAIRPAIIAEVVAAVRADSGASPLAELQSVLPKDPGAALAARAQAPAFVSSGPVDRNSVGQGASFEISAGQENSRATIRVARMSSTSVLGRPGEDSRIRSITDAWSFSAPAEKSGPTNLATLDGFANASELKFERTVWNVKGIMNRPAREPEAYAAFCRDAGLEPRCESDKVRDALEKLGKKERLAEFEAFMDDPDLRVSSWGGKFKVGHQEFDYFDPMLAKADTTEIYWGAGAHYGWIPKHKDLLLQIGVDWQRSHTAAKTATACSVSDQPVLSCVTGALRAPTEKTKHLVYAEARGAIGKPSWLPGPGKEMGISLRATHDFRNDESGVDLPIYLLQDTSGGFTGGVRVGWTSADQFGFGVFVGSALKIFE